MSAKDTARLQTYELLEDRQPWAEGSIPAQHRPLPPRDLWRFIISRPDMLFILVIGTAAAMACFGFTRWLSLQVLSCPSWALYCEVQSPVHWFISRLGLVQGIVSSIYGISITMMGYTIYQLAETTLWPAWAQQVFTPRDVDRFLSHARGSLPSFPRAIWHARTASHMAVVLVVGCFGILLHINSALIGYAYTVMPVATPLYSNHTIGGGFGFGFGQSNPPGPVPAAVTVANAMYSTWSTGQGSEPLPHLRHYMIDRANMSSIGNFTVNAIEVVNTINCYGRPIEMTRGLFNATPVEFVYGVNTSFGLELLVRWEPLLTSWIDDFQFVSNDTSITRIMFAQFNGTIEGGYDNGLTSNMTEHCKNDKAVGWLDYGCSGIVSLACDLQIELKDGQACNGECVETDATVSSIQTLSGPGITTPYAPGPRDLTVVGQWLGGVVSTMGEYVWGTQPVWQPGTVVTANTTNVLPVSFTDTTVSNSVHWSLANITNLIDVSVGALASATVLSFPRNTTANVTVESTLPLARFSTRRSLALLAPPAIALGIIVILAILNVIMHREAGVERTRLGWTSEILLSCQTTDVTDAADDVLSHRFPVQMLEHKKLRYGELVSGCDGVANNGNVKPFIQALRFLSK